MCGVTSVGTTHRRVPKLRHEVEWFVALMSKLVLLSLSLTIIVFIIIIIFIRDWDNNKDWDTNWRVQADIDRSVG